MPETLHERIERERKEAQPHAADVPVYRRYARGDQDKVMSADQMRQIAGITKHKFADNACGKILALIASRLEFTGWRTDGTDDGSVQRFLDTVFYKNQLGDVQFTTHYASSRDSNSALTLGWKAGATPADGRPVIHRDPWWDGKTGMFVAYGDDREKVYAVKDFYVTMGDPPKPRLRRIVYWPDRIDRFILSGKQWQPFDPSGNDQPSVPWTKRDNSPLGIPVVHFANGSDEDSPYGISVLGGGVVGLQDHLNDVHWDITVAARLVGFPMFTATGYQPPMINGQAQPLKTGPGTVLTSTSPQTKFDVVQPGDLKQLIDVYQMKLRALASNTHTPEHVITGSEWPSGLALIRAEMPLIDQVKRLAKTYGPSWQEVGHRCTEIQNAFGASKLNEDALITAQFADPERLDEQAQAESRKLALDVWTMAAAIDDDVILKKTGLFTDAEIAEMRRERTQRQQQAMAALIGAGGPSEGEVPA